MSKCLVCRFANCVNNIQRIFWNLSSITTYRNECKRRSYSGNVNEAHRFHLLFIYSYVQSEKSLSTAIQLFIIIFCPSRFTTQLLAQENTLIMINELIIKSQLVNKITSTTLLQIIDTKRADIIRRKERQAAKWSTNLWCF